jgi:hypothetical protein
VIETIGNTVTLGLVAAGVVACGELATGVAGVVLAMGVDAGTLAAGVAEADGVAVGALEGVAVAVGFAGLDGVLVNVAEGLAGVEVDAAIDCCALAAGVVDVGAVLQAAAAVREMRAADIKILLRLKSRCFIRTPLNNLVSKMDAHGSSMVLIYILVANY